MDFASLRLLPPLLDAVHAEGYVHPTPIQQQAIPHVLDGRDLLGCAQTGTGKTAAFALPILQRLVTTPRGATPVGSGRRPVRVLVLTPTRELASQIGESFATYGRLLPTHRVQGVPLKPLRHTVIFGGVGQNPQEQALRAGVDIVVATPGRLLDLSGQGLIALDRVEIFVLDEADRMLDMGFLHDVKRVIALLPRERQTLFFSATMPEDIRDLADTILRDPCRVAVAPVASTVDTVEQHAYLVEKGDKVPLLVHLLGDPAIRRALIFTRTKHGANKLVAQLGKAGISGEAIHGNKSQRARERALAGFKAGETRVLVATDIAARGIDIDDITHVVNFEMPNVPETYVHRIGRTARAGASGVALSLVDHEEREYLADIVKLIRREVEIVADHPFRSSVPLAAPRTQGRAGSRPAAAPPRDRPSQAPRGRGHRGSAPSTPPRPTPTAAPRPAPSPPRAGDGPSRGAPAAESNEQRPSWSFRGRRSTVFSGGPRRPR